MPDVISVGDRDGVGAGLTRNGIQHQKGFTLTGIRVGAGIKSVGPIGDTTNTITIAIPVSTQGSMIKNNRSRSHPGAGGSAGADADGIEIGGRVTRYIFNVSVGCDRHRARGKCYGNGGITRAPKGHGMQTHPLGNRHGLLLGITAGLGYGTAGVGNLRRGLGNTGK